MFSLSKQDQLTYFKNFIKAKQRNDSLIISKEIEKKKFQILDRSKTAFYFYNPNQILKGKQSYLARWGNRPNVNNWRNANSLLNFNETENPRNEKSFEIKIIQETPESFVSSLPKTKKEKDSILLINQTAYLQLGMIYKEKFNDYSLAHKRFERLLKLNPADELKVQALYHLYKINDVDTSAKETQ